MGEWEKKQADFLAFLQSQSAEEAPYRVDLEKRKIYWVDEHELSLAVADCRVLLSYALSNHSVMMAWANSSLAAGASIEPVEGMDDVYPDCDPQQVWLLATMVASAAGAQAIYRTPSPQSWVFLGLWNLRPGGAEQFTSGSPKQHILKVLDSLLNHPDFGERQVLIDNYAESFLQMARHPYKGTDYSSKLQDTARALRNLLAQTDPASQDRGLVEQQEYWARL